MYDCCWGFPTLNLRLQASSRCDTPTGSFQRLIWLLLVISPLPLYYLRQFNHIWREKYWSETHSINDITVCVVIICFNDFSDILVAYLKSTVQTHTHTHSNDNDKLYVFTPWFRETENRPTVTMHVVRGDWNSMSKRAIGLSETSHVLFSCLSVWQFLNAIAYARLDKQATVC